VYYKFDPRIDIVASIFAGLLQYPVTIKKATSLIFIAPSR
jgi:hypothetical protein